ncbi:hypothetical protein F5B21DRAFT_503001 [Xylaria acuta]|nr:hypothetical protein F5B21DRAFT_503001 [Xylaria acuta]
MAVDARRILVARESSPASFAKICDAIAQSQSPAKTNPGHVAEVCGLVERAEDHGTIFVGWGIVGSRDLTITSWADLDLYGVAFGHGEEEEELGRPDFVRVSSSAAADGVGIILPRKRNPAATNEVIEIMIMLRSDDMVLLEQDTMWKDFRTHRPL